MYIKNKNYIYIKLDYNLNITLVEWTYTTKLSVNSQT